jgi:hypothetical protein
MKIGYGRVSTRDQNHDAQRDALAAAGCDQVFIDKASGKLVRRPELDRWALLVARAGDELVVTKLDRLGRSLEHLIDLSKGPAGPQRRPGGARPGHRHHDPGRAPVLHLVGVPFTLTFPGQRCCRMKSVTLPLPGQPLGWAAADGSGPAACASWLRPISPGRTSTCLSASCADARRTA